MRKSMTVNEEMKNPSNGSIYITLIGLLALLCAALTAIVLMTLYKSDQLAVDLHQASMKHSDMIQKLDAHITDGLNALNAESSDLSRHLAEAGKRISELENKSTGQDKENDLIEKVLAKVENKIGPLLENGSQGPSSIIPVQAKENELLKKELAEVENKILLLEKNSQDLSAQAKKLDHALNASRTNEADINEINTQVQGVGTLTNPGSSCETIKRTNPAAVNGLYHIKDIEGHVFETYCDIAGGGWTLVASIHENNMKGRCTTGDRWSSEQGNSDEHPHGDGFWENRATHGEAPSATSDDYKNSGYFALNASNIMIWQVPNNTPMESFATKAFLNFHTTNGFLGLYGGNLASLYSNHFPMRAEEFRVSVDNGPAIPIVWTTGNNDEMLSLLGDNVKKEVEPGYVQFRAINMEQNAFALCPGVKIRDGQGNTEHPCLGSTSHNIGPLNEERYCGDFSARDWTLHPGWNSDKKLIDSVVMIFYK